MSDEIDEQMYLNRELQNNQRLLFNDPHSINPYKKVFQMYEERMMHLSNLENNDTKKFFEKSFKKKFGEFSALKERRKTHIRLFRKQPIPIPSESRDNEKEYLTPNKYTLLKPRKNTNSFDTDLIWNEKASYNNENLKCFAALADKPDIYILSVVYQDPFALDVYDIEVGLGGKYKSMDELLLQKSKLKLKSNHETNMLNEHSYLIAASDLQRVDSNTGYVLPSAKENISTCVFGTLDEILALCDIAYTEEPSAVGFAAAPLEEVLRVLALYMLYEKKFLQFLKYKPVTTPSFRKPRLTPIASGENERDPYDDWNNMESVEEMAPEPTSPQFVKEFDDFMAASVTFPFSPRT